MTAEARALKKARAKRRVYEKPKPRNWQLVDPMFNFSICDELGLEIEDKLDGGLSTADKFSAYHCFTDGSFIRGQGAGWSFGIFQLERARGDTAGEGKPFLTATGPIVALRKSFFFLFSFFFLLGQNVLLQGWRKLMLLLRVYCGGPALGKQRGPELSKTNQP
jgi:hypothetical protein